MTYTFEIADDSGHLALVDPASYKSFVNKDWEVEDLVVLFTAESAEGSLVFWGTGREETWRVEVRDASTTEPGFREFRTRVNVTGSSLLLTNYETLTMAAQYRDEILGADLASELLIPSAPGAYECRVVQRFDPNEGAQPGDVGPHFIIELTPARAGDQTICDAGPLPWTDFG